MKKTSDRQSTKEKAMPNTFATPLSNRQVYQLFDHMFSSLLFDNRKFGYSPNVELRETAFEVTVLVELPGVEEGNVSTMVSNNALVIRGEKKSTEKDNEFCYGTERFYGTFVRIVELPSLVDAERVSTHFDRGVLEVILHKKVSETSKATKSDTKP